MYACFLLFWFSFHWFSHTSLRHYFPTRCAAGGHKGHSLVPVFIQRLWLCPSERHCNVPITFTLCLNIRHLSTCLCRKYAWFWISKECNITPKHKHFAYRFAFTVNSFTVFSTREAVMILHNVFKACRRHFNPVASPSVQRVGLTFCVRIANVPMPSWL